MSYTKGPWSISRRSKSTELKDIFISAGGEYVARVVVPYTSKSLEEYESNARLIAAAPELLEALKLVTPLFDMHDDCASIDATSSARKIAYAAIAKATGENNG